MRRRRGGFGIFGFILFIMMFDLIDYGIDLLYYFMPLIVFGLVGFGFAKECKEYNVYTEQCP